jgi:hypothetical protein
VKEAAATTVAVLIGIALLVTLLVADVRPDFDDDFGRAVVATSLVAGITAVPAAFAGAYYRLSAAHPSAFNEPLSKIDSLYLAVITFTTTGFRDVSARSATARVLIMFELAGALVVHGLAAALLIRRLTR